MYTIIGVSIKIILLGKRSQTQRSACCLIPLVRNVRKFKVILTESRSVLVSVWEEGKGIDFKRTQGTLGLTQTFCISVAVGVARLPTFTKTHHILHLKLVTFIVCKLYLRPLFFKSTGFFLYLFIPS